MACDPCLNALRPPLSFSLLFLRGVQPLFLGTPHTRMHSQPVCPHPPCPIPLPSADGVGLYVFQPLVEPHWWTVVCICCDALLGVRLRVLLLCVNLCEILLCMCCACAVCMCLLQNISGFLTAARALGLAEFDCFSTPDLFEDKNMGQVPCQSSSPNPHHPNILLRSLPLPLPLSRSCTRVVGVHPARRCLPLHRVRLSTIC
jgi:hypothetical protein